MKKIIIFVIITIVLIAIHQFGLNIYSQNIAKYATEQVTNNDTYYLMNKNFNTVTTIFEVVLFSIWVFITYRFFIKKNS